MGGGGGGECLRVCVRAFMFTGGGEGETGRGAGDPCEDEAVREVAKSLT